jgi:hypothetical protein
MKEELIGLEIVEENTIKCRDCSAPLVEIVISENNDHRVQRGLRAMHSKYKVTNCYKCGSSSFQSKVFHGSTNICPSKEFLILEPINTDVIDDNIIYTVLEIRRKNG